MEEKNDLSSVVLKFYLINLFGVKWSWFFWYVISDI